MPEHSGKCDLTVIVLTLNEEMHIQRCIESVGRIASRIVVIDSGSTDRTREIAVALGADVYQNRFVNYSKQFNWALDNASIGTQWVMRLDADEYITQELGEAIVAHLSDPNANAAGFTLNLRRVFMGRWLRHGALYPVRLLRIWRFGAGRCEERWMDEHVVLRGAVRSIEADFVDHNLNSLTWWTDKHNKYASREAVDLLNLEYHFMPRDRAGEVRGGEQASAKRWLKEKVYARLPGGVRAFAYFLYRYVVRLGFLDGREGAIFHVLQGFWYRYLVDAKVAEVKRHMAMTGSDVMPAIAQVLGIDVGANKA